MPGWPVAFGLVFLSALDIFLKSPMGPYFLISGELKEGAVVSRQALFWQLLIPVSASFGVGTFEGCLRKDLVRGGCS